MAVSHSSHKKRNQPKTTFNNNNNKSNNKNSNNNHITDTDHLTNKSNITESNDSSTMMLLNSNNNSNNNNSNNNHNNNSSSMRGAASTSNSTYASGSDGVLYRRIREPHPNDVLSGRGGSINAHSGNIQFREWVRVRKNDYTLAHNKADKTRVAQQVIDLVRQQEPPGKFLQKDPSFAGWWVELDEERVMAKTSQALREGAPQIRAAHKQPSARQTHGATRGRASGRKSVTKTTVSAPSQPLQTSPVNHTNHNHVAATTKDSESSFSKKRPFTSLTTAAQQQAIQALQANVIDAQTHLTPAQQYEYVEQVHDSCGPEFELKQHYDQAINVVAAEEEHIAPASKRVRVEYNGHTLRPTDDSPILVSRLPAQGPPPMDLATVPSLPARRHMGERAHSLALTDLNHTPRAEEDWEFVNPFEDESFLWGGVNHGTITPATTLAPAASSSTSHPPGDSSESEGLAPSMPPRVGIFHRDISASSDMGGLGALLRDDSKKNNNNVRATSTGSKFDWSLGDEDSAALDRLLAMEYSPYHYHSSGGSSNHNKNHNSSNHNNSEPVVIAPVQ